MKTLAHWSLLSVVVGGCVVEGSWAQQPGSVTGGMPGRTPGTECWIVQCTRGYNLRQALQAVRQAAPALRPALIVGLRQQAQVDQAAIAQAVAAAGGLVRRHYWHLSAISIEVPAATVPVLRQLPRVLSVWPVTAGPSLDAGAYPARVADAEVVLKAPIPPMATSVNANNHNVEAAWNILGTPTSPYRGAGACVAVFDSGIDKDIDDNSPSTIEPHPAFLVAGSSTVSRVVAHLQVDSLNGRNADINILTSTSPFVLPGTPPSGSPPYSGTTSGYVQNLPNNQGRHHRACGHGTAMAAIVAGYSYPEYPLGTGSVYQAFAGHGHAPDAEIVDVACSSYPPPPFADARSPWVYTTEGHLGAVEALREYILQGGFKVHVVCLSLSGQPSPDDPISLSYDRLARDEDILLVTAAGNESDSTMASNGFYHGLAVGAVHARVGPPANPQNLLFVPMVQSSRGPLVQNAPGRFYPDLCATGAGIHFTPAGLPEFYYPASNAGESWLNSDCITMPGVDMRSPSATATTIPPNQNVISPVRPALGTSEAAAQVAGAATLYRGYVTNATAEETRAALLLSVIGTYSAQNGQTSEPATQHTYTGRNTFGVGYLRDDLLAEFAKRDPSIEPLTALVTLTPASPSNDTTQYAGLAAGKRYAAVACWRRSYAGSDLDLEGPLPNVRLEIVDASNPTGGGVVIARADSPANSYERVVFQAPASGTVKLRVVTADVSLITPPLPPLDVQLVARRLSADVDPVTSNPGDHVLAASGAVEVRSAGSGCTATDYDWVVDRIVPYDWAYGSAPFKLQSAPSPPAPPGCDLHLGYARGFDLGMGRASSQNYTLHVEYQNHPQVTGVGPMTIRGIAFRTWKPLDDLNANDLPVSIWLKEMVWWTPGTSVPPTPESSGAVQVVGGTSTGPRTIGSPAAIAPGVAAVATGREDFNIVVPFDVPFTYNNTQSSALSLHMWIRVQSGAPVLIVDGTDDGPGQPIESHYHTGGPTGVVTLDGQAPVIGLIAESTSQPRELRLVAHGEPWSASSSGPVCNFDAHLFAGLPGGTLWWLYMDMGGWSDTPTVIPPCSSWLTPSAQLIGSGTTDAYGMLRFSIAVSPGFVHAEFGLQALLLPGSGWRMSNALRVHVGGGL